MYECVHIRSYAYICMSVCINSKAFSGIVGNKSSRVDAYEQLKMLQKKLIRFGNLSNKKPTTTLGKEPKQGAITTLHSMLC